MADSEKVKKGLECHKSGICDNGKMLCPYWKEEADCSKKLIDDALELLKEQEPVKPIEGDPVTQGFKYLCGKCHWKIVRNYTYCEHCGKKVKWE